MNILSARIENFKRIELACVDSGGKPVVEITGKNGAGKSSVLDALEAALGGRRRHPSKPVRRGAEKARVVVKLEGIVVERVWKEGGHDRLIVRRDDAEGAIIPRAQAKLDDLIGALSFDPLAFAEEPPARQREILLELAGVDLGEISERHEAAYAERREARRLLDIAKARLSGLPEVDAETPDEEISQADLVAELDQAIRQRDANAARRRDLDLAHHAAADARRHAADADRLVREAEAALRQAQERAVTWKEQATKAAGEAEKISAEVEKLKDPDVGEIQERIRQVDAVNRGIRAKKARAAVKAEVDQHQAAFDDAQKRVIAAEKDKLKALDEAKMPIEGLSVGDECVAYRGIPLSQASTSERIRVCTAISAALNPSLKIALVRGGNDLDDETLAGFYAACEEAGVQAWVERIKGSRADAVEIVEGNVAEEVKP